MNGYLIKNTPIAVDLWRYKDIRNAKLFFLTHLHQDHITGLTASWRQPIYTSPLNVILLKKKFQFPDGVTIPLELYEPHIIYMDDDCKLSMAVTLIDANHVPGAVMFLFQGYFGNILYCGDMRYDPQVLSHPNIQQVLSSGGIDLLYLDNTYCDPIFTFPSRDVVREQVFRVIDAHPNHNIKLGMFNLGKEELLESIAKRFEERILVSPERYELLKCMMRPDVYTCDPSQARIEAVGHHTMHFHYHGKCDKTAPTLCIRLTALHYGDRSEGSLTDTVVHTLPYSDHSSYNELVQFVEAVRPIEIIPIVRRRTLYKVADSKRADMSLFDSCLGSPLSAPVKVPQGILETDRILPKYGALNKQGKKSRILKAKRKKCREKGAQYCSLESLAELRLSSDKKTVSSGNWSGNRMVEDYEQLDLHHNSLPKDTGSTEDSRSHIILNQEAENVDRERVTESHIISSQGAKNVDRERVSERFQQEYDVLELEIINAVINPSPLHSINNSGVAASTSNKPSALQCETQNTLESVVNRNSLLRQKLTSDLESRNCCAQRKIVIAPQTAISSDCCSIQNSLSSAQKRIAPLNFIEKLSSSNYHIRSEDIDKQKAFHKTMQHIEAVVAQLKSCEDNIPYNQIQVACDLIKSSLSTF